MATKTDLERLVVSLEASITKYEKAMAKAAAVGDARAKQIEKRFTKLEGVLKNFGGQAFSKFGATAIGALAPVLTLTGGITAAKAALEEFGGIADKSAAAGVDPEFFQGIAYQAKLAGVDIEGVAGALAAFAKNSGLAAEGKGRMVTALQALDPELLKSIQAATTQEERFLAVADAIERSKTAAEAAAIASAAFGDQGTRLVAVLRNGAAEIERLNASAKEMGLVVDRSLIAQADELGDKLDTAAQIVQTKLNVGFVALAPLMVDAAGWAAEFARLMAVAYEQTKAIDQRQFVRPLQNALAATYNAMEPLKERIKEIRHDLALDGTNKLVLNMDLSDSQAQLDALTAKANELLSRIQELQGYKAPVIADPAVDPREALLANMAGRGGEGRVKPVEPFYTPGGVKSTSSRDEAAAAAIRQAKAIESLISDLQFEQQTISLSANEQEVLNTLRRAGVDATSAQGQQIRQLVTAINEQKAAQENLKQTMDALQQSAQSFVSDFVSGLREGKSAADSFASALGNLGNKLLDMAANQAISALLGGLTGGLTNGLTPKAVTGIGFGRPLANGGNVTPGRAHMVGEGGPEMFIPKSAGTIIANKKLGGGGVNLTIHIDARGAELGVEERIARQIEATVPRMIKAQAPAAVAGAQRNRTMR